MNFSIIIPCFNREETIQRSIESILNQTIFKNNDFDFEIIVVDDHSIDDSVRAIEAMNCESIKLIKLNKNKGSNFARNIGINNSNGDYIAFQDSDDEWLTTKLEEQFRTLKEKKADVVFSSLYSIDGNNKKIIPDHLQEGFVKVTDLLLANKMSTQVILGYRSCFIKEQFDESLLRFQDWELAIRLSQNYQVYFMDKPLAIQYLQSNSISKNPHKAVTSLEMIKDKHFELFMVEKYFYSKLLEKIASFSALSGQNPDKYLKEALTVNFSYNLYIKYILNKLNIYIPIVKYLNR